MAPESVAGEGARAPSLASTARPDGINPSPQALSRGQARFSSTATRGPGARRQSPRPARPGRLRRRRRQRAHRSRLGLRVTYLALGDQALHLEPGEWPAPSAAPRRRGDPGDWRRGQQRRRASARRSLPLEVRGSVPGWRRQTVCGRTPVRSRMAARIRSSRVGPASRVISARTSSSSPPLGQEAERHRAPVPQAGHGVQALLELLRRVVGAADDHHVLGAAADVELAVGDEAEVAGVEPAVDEHAGGGRGILRSNRPSPTGPRTQMRPVAPLARPLRASSRTSSSTPGTATPEAIRRSLAVPGEPPGPRRRAPPDRRPATAAAGARRREAHRQRRLRHARTPASARARSKPQREKRAANSSSTPTDTGSAPLRAKRQLDRSSPSRSASFTRFRQSE